jgi:hypothetical protein
MDEGPQRYAIIVKGDSLEEVVEETAHLFYMVLSRTLRAHRRHHSEECPFEEFALEALAVLTKYREVYSNEVATASDRHE